ncbi:MAG: fructose-bisphosphate aldolase class I [Arenicellales bacterium]|jgi:fructose-bisphosphate aldolase class I|nr:fructose-bisphosphate aldolase class I [Acidiferrobacteraceae bacterium]MBT7182453.1 fructose-bisphosphate aldolase class I [Acidiferrobacteraceae bacterium]MDE0978072.1 fructose-bisphosphate aldolase class I [Arenicellales bacterium]MDP7221559.1 fructose-bisphosphate aldolase class I [Arenicellales bacterium]HIE75527.1 fructose-bisphosphate aldolase class I [Gammaproteobacteria bacterium]|tara:strand:- start:222 stop:1244 length:1023 start_codon:yes stop_codon:yes gene_type:complete
MNIDTLQATARAMVAPGKGILAMDESSPTCNKRFEALGIPATIEMRREYRTMLVSSPGLGEYIGGAILFDETLRDQTTDGKSFVDVLNAQDIVPGIKVDTGAKDLALHPGEKVTEGLDGLGPRLAEYHELGARFAKWRAVYAISDALPSQACFSANAHGLARYAALCQAHDIVPIVEPEVLIDGSHSIERSFQVTQHAQQTVFEALADQGVDLRGIVLKPSMVISGAEANNRAGVDEVARETLRCLLSTVPPAVPGIAFLSGGQSDEEATMHLNAMHHAGVALPWAVTFSYGRALQAAAMTTWAGQSGNVDSARAIAFHRARMNGVAALGEYSPELEKAA